MFNFFLPTSVMHNSLCLWFYLSLPPKNEKSAAIQDREASKHLLREEEAAAAIFGLTFAATERGEEEAAQRRGEEASPKRTRYAFFFLSSRAVPLSLSSSFFLFLFLSSLSRTYLLFSSLFLIISGTTLIFLF